MKIDYVRVTDITDYMFCPRKVYLKRVLGMEEEPKEAMVLGSIIHEVLELLNKNEQEIVYKILEPMDFGEILQLYKEAVEDYIKKGIDKFKDLIYQVGLEENQVFTEVSLHLEQEILDRAKNAYVFMKDHDIYGIELWDKMIPKLLSEVELLSDKYQLVGRIDRIEDYGNFIVPVEIKTGNPAKNGVKYPHKVQLSLYNLLLLENFPKKRVGPSYIYYTKVGEKREVKVKNSTIKFALKIKDNIITMVEEERDPGLKNNIKSCKKCFFYNFCYKS